MRPFAYQRAKDASAAVAALAAAATDNNPLTESAVQPLAGGTTLIDLMKLDVMRPGTLIDINPLASAWSTINLEDGNLRLGALARMSDVAANRDRQSTADTKSTNHGDGWLAALSERPAGELAYSIVLSIRRFG